jgi:tetratricopeptide (TPR) repeat protein
MQAKRFWHPTKHKLLYANFIVYGVIFVLIPVFHHELVWAQKTLYGYLISGNIPPSADKLLIGEAIKHKQKGEDVNSVQPLLERAVQIEPYSEANILLGYCYQSRGDYDKALVCYEKYRLANPYYAGLYKEIIEILEKKQDHKAIEQLLTEGIRRFQQRIELYKPHYDSNVPEVFNQKASAVYKDAQDGLNFLEKMQEQSNISK